MFDIYGNIQPGFHDYDESKFKSDFVDKFNESKTRLSIFEGYKSHKSILKHIVKNCEQWIGGSYTTNKIDPGDIDFVCLINKDEVDAIPQPFQDALMHELFGPDRKTKYSCDSYFVLLVDEDHENYAAINQFKNDWESFWGRDRQNRSRGIVRTYL